MLQQNVICPWCQRAMYPIQQVIEDGMIRRGPEQLRNYYYECECGAESPVVYKVCTHEEAENELADLLNIDTSTYLVVYMSNVDGGTMYGHAVFSTESTGALLFDDAYAEARRLAGRESIIILNICKLD